MKRKASYINSIPFRHGEITVVTSDHAEATMQHSARLANSVKETGLNVLAINCGMSDRRFREHFYQAHGREAFKEPRCIIKSSVCGNLIGEREAIDQIVDEAKIAVVIISGWEFASSTSRRRQRLLFYLRELMERENVAIIIYSHIANDPVAGMIDHGGLGKLSLLAYAIAEIDSSKILDDEIRKPAPLVATMAELREMGADIGISVTPGFRVGAQASGNGINNLEGVEEMMEIVQ
jgi:hypothetical protein